jgi:cyanophycin synthetase
MAGIAGHSDGHRHGLERQDDDGAPARGVREKHGWHAGYNCTDGVFLDEEALAAGDYSGPAGARMVMRDRRTEAAILETARGGILRRGIAVSQADAAVVTNVSSDHFGEYGIHDLAGLAEVKLAVAAVVGRAACWC